MKIILTGDRPTGKLHLGHYIGSLKNRVLLQNDYKINIIIANTQALTDYFDRPELVQHNIFQLVEDYLSCGIDPEKCCIFVQSEIKGLFEITHYFSNLVSLSRLQRNPTIKEELKNKKFANNILTGFLCYPISQAADILSFKPDLIPVGVDQLPMIEQSNEIANKFNSTYQCSIFKECKPLINGNGKLIGTNGINKASKSLNNAIYLSDDDETLKSKVNSMYTDPNHIKRSDAGNVQNNVVFHYLDAFCEEFEYVEQLKKDYEANGVNLGDMELKNILFNILKQFLSPIRERRNKIDKKTIKNILIQGNKQANLTVNKTLNEIYEIFYKNKEY